MRHHNRFSWMIRPRSFIKLMGAEYDLMQKAGGYILTRFYISSILIFIIAVISFLSVRYAVALLFHITIVEVLLSVFISMLFVMMYIFLINTFSKEIRGTKIFNLSNMMRLGFVVFMGFIISKPIEIWLYKDDIDRHVETYKQQLNSNHLKMIEQLFAADIDKLARKQQLYEALKLDIDAANISADIARLNTKKTAVIFSSEYRINDAHYFLYRVQTVCSNYPLSWMISLMVILLFLLPGFLIYIISMDDAYYRMKVEQERRIIQNAYDAFSEKYTSLLGKYEPGLVFYSKYEDPPFNCRIKTAVPGGSTTDFHNKYGAL